MREPIVKVVVKRSNPLNKGMVRVVVTCFVKVMQLPQIPMRNVFRRYSSPLRRLTLKLTYMDSLVFLSTTAISTSLSSTSSATYHVSNINTILS